MPFLGPYDLKIKNHVVFRRMEYQLSVRYFHTALRPPFWLMQGQRLLFEIDDMPRGFLSRQLIIIIIIIERAGNMECPPSASLNS